MREGKGGTRKGYLTRYDQIAHYLTCPGLWDDSIVEDDRGNWRSGIVGVELDPVGQLIINKIVRKIPGNYLYLDFHSPSVRPH